MVFGIGDQTPVCDINRPGQPRPETTYTYDSAGLLVSSTDPLGQTNTYTYDNAKRVVATTYPDSTTEQSLYGTGANAGRVIKTKDRMGMVTTMTYDNSGLLTQQVVSAAIDANILANFAAVWSSRRP